MAAAPLAFADEFLDAVVDAARVGICIVNANGVLVRVNPAFCEFLGYSREEVTGKHFTIATPPEITARATEFLAAVLAESPRVKDEWRIRRKDGAILDALVSFKPLTVSGGNQYIVVTFTDITARKQAESSLRESEERFRQLAENIQEVFWIADPAAGGLLYISPAYATIWGRDPDELLKDLAPFVESVHPEDRARVAAAQELQASGGYHEEYRIVRPDGAIRWIRDRAFPVRNSRGEVYRIAGIATDITERRFTVERFRQLNVELERRIAERTSELTSANLQLRAEIEVRARTESELREVNERVRLLIDTANDAVVTIDDASVIIDWNAAAERAFGWLRHEAVGRILTDLIVPARHRDAHHAGLQRFLSGGPHGILNRRVETTGLKRDGTEFDIELSVWPVRAGNRYTFSAFIRDISERKLAELALAQSEERYRAVVENAEEGIIVAQDGYLRFANPKAIALTGRTPVEVYGTPFIDMIHAADQARVRDNYVKRLRGEVVENQYNFRVTHRNGEVRWLQISAVMIEWEGRPGTLNFLTDVTERQLAEVALAQSEERYRAVVEHAEEGIIVAQDGFLRYANSKALTLTGRSVEQAYGTPFLDMVHADDRARVRDNYLKRLRGEPTENQYQIRALHADGSIRWLQVSAVMIQWEGKPAALNLLADVTARRQMEEELRRNLERERELSELKTRFVAMTSHEFRTPLATILSSAELIEDHGERLPKAERTEVLGIIKNAVARMNEMISQVLLIGRTEAGLLEFRPAGADPSALCLALAHEALDNRQRARLAFKYEGDAAPRMLDARLMRYILGNLISNAVKYSPSGSEITLTVACKDAHLVVGVTDRGIGIAPADQARLFDIFHRGANVGTVEGTGLGLSIVRQCVDLHGGSITVRSRLDAGSTFTFRLPAPPAA
jgi:PAS domain S-box-containing protein